jgi:hypothetical protein
VGGRGRDNLVRGILRTYVYGNPVASSLSRRNARKGVGQGLQVPGLRYVLIPRESVCPDGVPTARGHGSSREVTFHGDSLGGRSPELVVARPNFGLVPKAG